MADRKMPQIMSALYPQTDTLARRLNALTTYAGGARIAAELAGTDLGPANMKSLVADLVDAAARHGYPPSPELVELVYRALGVVPLAQRRNARHPGFWRAVELEAFHPELSQRKLAAMTGATAKAIRSWQRDPEYREAVDRVRTQGQERRDSPEAFNARLARVAQLLTED
jgi:hypothetical protein